MIWESVKQSVKEFLHVKFPSFLNRENLFLSISKSFQKKPTRIFHRKMYEFPCKGTTKKFKLEKNLISKYSPSIYLQIYIFEEQFPKTGEIVCERSINVNT